MRAARFEDGVSIHAPAREATLESTAEIPLLEKFRSTPPRGRRHSALGKPLQNGRVSIHAPAREATRRAPMIAPRLWCFDPRPREGGDAEFDVARVDLSLFRSTPPRGRRPPFSAGYFGLARFDPRPREGGDVTAATVAGCTKQFRSTPPRGRRPRKREATMAIYWFRSTPPRGRRRGRCKWILQDMDEFRSTPPRGRRQSQGKVSRRQKQCFDPRPREGGDFQRRIIFRRKRRFRSTPPRGRRRAFPCARHRCRAVSIHAPAREATGPSARVFRLPGVSIHAPAREATFPLNYPTIVKNVSIHAPAREATALPRRGATQPHSFDPRPREGGDRCARASLRAYRTFRSTPPRGRRQ